MHIALRLRCIVVMSRRRLGLATFSGGTRTIILFSGWATILILWVVAYIWKLACLLRGWILTLATALTWCILMIWLLLVSGPSRLLSACLTYVVRLMALCLLTNLRPVSVVVVYSGPVAQERLRKNAWLVLFRKSLQILLAVRIVDNGSILLARFPL